MSIIHILDAVCDIGSHMYDDIYSLSVISHLRWEDHDMVLWAVRVGIEGERVLNYRHVVSHEFPTPYEVDNQLPLLLLHPLSHPPGSVTRTACQPRSVLFCR